MPGLNDSYGFAATADIMAYLGIAQVNKEDQKDNQKGKFFHCNFASA